MEFGPFFLIYRNIAEKETRVLSILKPDYRIPLGEYALIEFYCDDNTCDCRKVIITVVDANDPNKTFATIGYGWESFDFYVKWMYGDEKTAKKLVGAYLEPIGIQSQFARLFLQFFKRVVLKDKLYKERLTKHYTIYKSNQKTSKLN